jgi:hypothetical protein
MIKKILKWDVDVNIKTEEGCTPLYQLIIKGVLPELFALFTSTLWFINISMTF